MAAPFFFPLTFRIAGWGKSTASVKRFGLCGLEDLALDRVAAVNVRPYGPGFIADGSLRLNHPDTRRPRAGTRLGSTPAYRQILA
jgi:hypothetical protein